MALYMGLRRSVFYDASARLSEVPPQLLERERLRPSGIETARVAPILGESDDRSDWFGSDERA
jgi:hypothetical protein